MTRTAIRHTLSARAAMALIAALGLAAMFVTTAQAGNGMPVHSYTMTKKLVVKPAAKAAKGYATKKSSQRSHSPSTLEISCGNTF